MSSSQKKPGQSSTTAHEQKMDSGDWLAWGLLIFCTVLFIAVCYYGVRWGWKMWQSSAEIITAMEQRQNQPDPVKKQDGQYHFPLQNTLFVIADECVSVYQRTPTDGRLVSITLEMLLPDPASASSNQPADLECGEITDDKLLEVVIYEEGQTQRAFEQRWFEHLYSADRQQYGATTVNDAPRIDYVAASGREYYYYFSGDNTVSRILRCDQADAVSDPACQMDLTYEDKINIRISYRRQGNPAGELIHIGDAVLAFLHAHEQPLQTEPAP